ncbi:hypothetical protein EVAR_32716_1 [Eumeta japonica]|uniref:Uncharacterized protein n=1 Tax=Eumeta variegata TaxID=151549 RepID=A0A4C1ZDZ6_EUMVA|nr:hypothetical protein EVAR_32716_1 [Eumeta japonica]
MQLRHYTHSVMTEDCLYTIFQKCRKNKLCLVSPVRVQAGYRCRGRGAGAGDMFTNNAARRNAIQPQRAASAPPPALSAQRQKPVPVLSVGFNVKIYKFSFTRCQQSKVNIDPANSHGRSRSVAVHGQSARLRQRRVTYNNNNSGWLRSDGRRTNEHANHQRPSGHRRPWTLATLEESKYAADLSDKNWMSDERESELMN